MLQADLVAIRDATEKLTVVFWGAQCLVKARGHRPQDCPIRTADAVMVGETDCSN